LELDRALHSAPLDALEFESFMKRGPNSRTQKTGHGTHAHAYTSSQECRSSLSSSDLEFESTLGPVCAADQKPLIVIE